SMLCRMPEGHRSARAPAIPDGRLLGADLTLGGAHEIGIEGQPELLTGRDPGLAVREVVLEPGHPELAAAAVILAFTTLVALGALEEGQHGLVVPALRTQIAPLVVVGMLAANVDKAVDRA